MRHTAGFFIMNEQTKLVTDTSEMNVIFVHSALDDAGLLAPDFRIYCHLSRRAGASGAFPSVASIAKVCRLERKTVFASLARLEERGMVTRIIRPGTSNVYVLTKPSQWLPVPNGTPSRLATHPVWPTTTHPERPTTYPSRLAYHEGYPMEGNPGKVIHGRGGLDEPFDVDDL
jgi:DNA-binding MarR family transcriptional regulator